MTDPSRDSRLENFPVMLMTTVMGLTGLSIVLMKFQHIFKVHWPMGQGLLYAVSALFVFLLGVYIVKLLRYPAAVAAEFRHPIRINFFPTISISLLLLSIAYLESGCANTARVLWLIGTPLHLVFLLLILKGWFHRSHKLESFNPAWFIPVVGPILVPVAGVQFASPEISWFFFSTGIVYWIVLFAVFANRIFFHAPMPQKLLPTLFIMIAPPAVGFIAYIKLTGSLDPFARVLFYFGVFTALLLMTMVDYFRRVPYFISWWGYTFPLDALTLSIFLMFKLTGLPFFKTAALVMTVVTTLTILVVLIKTLMVAARGEICVAED
jgi:tellurite resistance protein